MLLENMISQKIPPGFPEERTVLIKRVLSEHRFVDGVSVQRPPCIPSLERPWQTSGSSQMTVRRGLSPKEVWAIAETNWSNACLCGGTGGESAIDADGEIEYATLGLGDRPKMQRFEPQLPQSDP